MILEIEETFGDGFEVGKVVRSEDFPLDDGEIDFDLVEPTGMNGAVDQNDTRESMGGAIVDNPKYAAGIIIGRPSHDLLNQSVKRGDSIARFTTAEHCGAVNVERSQIGPSAAPLIFVFNFHGRPGLRGQGRMKTTSGLNAGFFIGGDDEFIVMKRRLVPDAFVKIEDAPGFGSKFRIARKYPGAVLPGTNRVGVKPTPYGAIADSGDQTRLANFSTQFPDAPSRQRHATSGRQFTSEGLNVNDQLWGENPGGARGGIAPQAPGGVFQRNAFATC